MGNALPALGGDLDGSSLVVPPHIACITSWVRCSFPPALGGGGGVGTGGGISTS